MSAFRTFFRTGLDHLRQEVILGWMRALDLRDHKTAGHMERVTRVTMALGERLGVTGPALKYLRWGAILHDVGKLSIPNDILNKPGSLTHDEWRLMRQHPNFAYEMF